MKVVFKFDKLRYLVMALVICACVLASGKDAFGMDPPKLITEGMDFSGETATFTVERTDIVPDGTYYYVKLYRSTYPAQDPLKCYESASTLIDESSHQTHNGTTVRYSLVGWAVPTKRVFVFKKS